MTTTTPRNICFFAVIFVFPFVLTLKMFAKNTAADLGGINTQKFACHTCSSLIFPSPFDQIACVICRVNSETASI